MNKKPKKSMMDLFIENELKADYDKYLHEITEEEYKKCLDDYEKYNSNHCIEEPFKKRFCDLSFWDNHLQDFNYPPFPLKEIIVLEDWGESCGENGSSMWVLVFLFKHKGKYYLFSDIDST